MEFLYGRNQRLCYVPNQKGDFPPRINKFYQGDEFHQSDPYDDTGHDDEFHKCDMFHH